MRLLLRMTVDYTLSGQVPGEGQREQHVVKACRDGRKEPAGKGRRLKVMVLNDESVETAHKREWPQDEVGDVPPEEVDLGRFEGTLARCRLGMHREGLAKSAQSLVQVYGLSKNDE